MQLSLAARWSSALLVGASTINSEFKYVVAGFSPRSMYVQTSKPNAG